MPIALDSDILTRPQARRWKEVVRACRTAYDATSGSGNPVVFHGTSAMRAAHIMGDGFLATKANTTVHGAVGVHWGVPHLNGCAAWCAEAAMEADDPPVMLMARLHDVLSSGTPAPDAEVVRLMDLGDVELDWRITLERGGAFVMVGGRHVRDVTALGLGDLPLHPRARQVRRERLAGGHGEGRPAFAIPQGFEFTDGTRFAPDSDVDVLGCVAYRPPDLERLRAMALAESAERARIAAREYDEMAAAMGLMAPR